MKSKCFRRILSMGAALLLTSMVVGCSSQTADSRLPTGGNLSVGDADATADIKLPEMEVTNSTLKVLTSQGVMEYCTETLADAYGLTDVQVTMVAAQDLRTRFLNAVMSQDSYDIYWDDFAPTLITGGYVVPIEVDMTLPLWNQIAVSNEQYMWNDLRYYVVPGFARQSCVYYNKSMFDEAGETYPTDLFDQGEWDWNKLLELAQTLTIDSNRDGTPEQYGLGYDEPEHILYTTGKHFVTFMPDGTARNNIESPEVARAVAYNLKLVQSGTLVPSNARQNFGEGSVAMCIGHRWYANTFPKLIQDDNLGYAPLPRDPEADKYYTAEEGGGYYIPKYAPNPDGALAAVNAIAYVIRSDEYKAAQYENPIENGLWSDELQAEYEKNDLIDAGVLRNWGAFSMGDYWGDVFSRPASGEPWETIAAELSPKIDARIKELYESKK